MGCDIHICTEALLHVNKTPTWCNVDNWRLNEDYGTDEDEPQYRKQDVYHDRNYELFSHLAGVRNYGGNKSFEFDRGVPTDVSAATKEQYESWGRDAHTPGWCNLKELKEAAAKCPKVSRKGYVSVQEIAEYQATGKQPSTWCQDYWPKDGRAQWFEWEDENHCFDKLIAALDERKRDVYWIFRAEDDDGRHDDKIRIVFWFDN